MSTSLADTIAELYEATPDNVCAVSYGHKTTGGVDTGELAVIFHVKEKKLIVDLVAEEVLPSTVECEGVIYVTDVKEDDLQVEFVTGACYQANTSASAAHRERVRPLRGGISISDQDGVPGTGTMGGLFLDATDNTVVGLTCAHVVVEDMVLNANKPKNISTFARDFSVNLMNQPGIYLDGGMPANDVVGFLKRFYHSTTTSTNAVDAAVFGISRGTANDILDSDSNRQLGTAFNLPVASTTEINSLLMNPKPRLEKYGRTTGFTGGIACPIHTTSMSAVVSIQYVIQETLINLVYTQCIFFQYQDVDANGKIYGNVLVPGDSGALLVADFNGTKKIVGLCFASATSAGQNQYGTGIACRIDRVMADLNLQEWDGVSGRFADSGKRLTTTTGGLAGGRSQVIDGKTYWQVGTVPDDIVTSSTLAFSTVTLPAADAWIDAAYGDGKYVLVANAFWDEHLGLQSHVNIALVSTDAQTWMSVNMPTAEGRWSSVAYGNGRFVAVCGNEVIPSDGHSSTIAATSPDGVAWTQRTLPSSGKWVLVRYGNGYFLALDRMNKKIARSADGVTWTQQSLSNSYSYGDIFAGNGVFVMTSFSAAVGNTGFNYRNKLTQSNDTFVHTSTDGLNWTTVNTPYAWHTGNFVNNQFVLWRGAYGLTGGNFGTQYFYASADGTNWSLSSSTCVFNSNTILNGVSLGYLSGKYVLGGRDSANRSIAAFSSSLNGPWSRALNLDDSLGGGGGRFYTFPSDDKVFHISSPGGIYGGYYGVNSVAVGNFVNLTGLDSKWVTFESDPEPINAALQTATVLKINNSTVTQIIFNNSTVYGAS